MAGIFLSYRRADSGGWAGRLFEVLARCYGQRRVFMDVDGIPRGVDYERTLAAALANCDALLVLIGPRWLTVEHSAGIRRLDVPGDWVRQEIAACLARRIPVFPVLVGGALMPAEGDLPAEISALHTRQQTVVADSDWNHHVRLLLRDLKKVAGLNIIQEFAPDDVDSANSGIRLLSNLIRSNRVVADAVGRSKEVVETTYGRIGRLEMFKTVHDALHAVEFECLRPMQTTGLGAPIRPFKIRFAASANRIRAALDGRDVNPGLHDDIVDGLAAVEAAFEALAVPPTGLSLARIVSELSALLSQLPPQLDSGISDAAREIDMNRLVVLMGTVRDALEIATDDTILAEFARGIDALQRLRDELAQRVTEHARLQRIDSKLRAVCVGGVTDGMLAVEWDRIKILRARLVSPLSPELDASLEELSRIEAEIEAQLGVADEPNVMDLVREYFQVMAGVFRDVDRNLKEFCLRLGTVSQSLRVVLDACG